MRCIGAKRRNSRVKTLRRSLAWQRPDAELCSLTGIVSSYSPDVKPQTLWRGFVTPTLAPNGDEMTSGDVLIHGTGLIGASIGLGLTEAGWSVSGWDPDREALGQAVNRGAILKANSDPHEGMSAADVVVLAGPSAATIATLRTIETPAVITDITSIKMPIVSAGSHLSRFVAGHPMAGSAASGVAHASSHLFHGAKWILCDDTASPDDVEKIGALVTSLGATPVIMSANDHDRSVALVSHLPRVLASALVQLASADPQALNVSAGSFRDLTRVAASGSDWWTDILITNAEQVGAAISELRAALLRISSHLEMGEGDSVADFLKETGNVRSHLAAHGAEVRVILFDRPGEIAMVGRALEESAVDLRDLQLRHAEHGGGGILTLTVGADEADDLRSALAHHEFEIEL